MELNYSLWFMMIGSFFIQLLLISTIMTNNYYNITFSLGKFYMSLIMAILMGLLEILMYDIHLEIISINYYLPLIFILIILIYLYRNQIYIDDKDYLEEMIEHHSMAILTSNEILQKSPSPRVKKLAEIIVETQENEIYYMKNLLKYQDK